jgi:hypothetical protein
LHSTRAFILTDSSLRTKDCQWFEKDCKAPAIVTRELIAAARQPRTYRRRSSLAILILLLVGLIYGVLYLRYQGTLSVAGFRTVMWCTFGGLIIFHYVLASELVPAHVAGLIAGERE